MLFADTVERRSATRDLRCQLAVVTDAAQSTPSRDRVALCADSAQSPTLSPSGLCLNTIYTAQSQGSSSSIGRSAICTPLEKGRKKESKKKKKKRKKRKKRRENFLDSFVSRGQAAKNLCVPKTCCVTFRFGPFEVSLKRIFTCSRDNLARC